MNATGVTAYRKFSALQWTLVPSVTLVAVNAVKGNRWCEIDHESRLIDSRIVQEEYRLGVVGKRKES